MNNFAEAIDFLQSNHPSRCFLSPLATKKTSLHEWARRGLLKFDNPGTGRALYLPGTEILFARCLIILSKSGGSPKTQTKGLRDVIGFFVKEAIEQQANTGKILPCYAVYRFVETPLTGNDWITDGEWEFYFDEDGKAFPYILGDKGRHITEAHGEKCVPFWSILNLTDILLDLSAKVWAAY